MTFGQTNSNHSRLNVTTRRAAKRPQRVIDAAVFESLERRDLFTSAGLQPPSDFPVGGFPLAVISGVDFNRDGKTDIATADYAAGTVSVLLGNGDGTFSAAISSSTGQGPSGLAAGDFNGDTIPDLAVAARTINTVAILLGTGSGSFAAPINFSSGGSYPSAVAVADFNGDSKADVAVSNNSGVGVLLGNGNGTFASTATYSSGAGAPAHLVAADFNADGRADLATANSSSANVSVLLNNGAGAFGSAQLLGVGTGPTMVAAADFNNDGKMDVASVNSSVNTISILRGTGGGAFASAVSFAGGNGNTAISAGDFNLDGKTDLVVNLPSNDGVGVLWGNGDATFSAPASYVTGPAPSGMTIADLNGDTYKDLIVANQFGNTVSTMLYSPVAPPPDTSAPTVSAISFVNMGSTGTTSSSGNDFAAVAGSGSAYNFKVTYSDNIAVNIATLDGSDLLVTGPGGYSQLASFLSVDATTNGRPRTATYRLTAPGGGWSLNHNGAYSVNLQGGQVSDTNSNAMAASVIATFQGTVTVPDSTAPVVAGVSLPPLTAAGSTAYNFTVTFSDNLAINATSFDSQDILIQGPGGFAQWAALVSVDVPGNGPTRTATYRVVPPSGSATWTTAHNGNYAVVLGAPGVLDTTGNSVPSANLGTFTVNVGGNPPPAAPVANAGGSYNVSEGGSVSLNGSASSGTNLTYAWDLDGDGVYGETGGGATRGSETGATPTFSASGLDGAGAFNVSLKVTDSANQVSTASATINISNVAPNLTISGAASVAEGSVYALNLASSELGPDTIVSWFINWGDGTSQTVGGNPSLVTKTYVDNGNYTITATATDEDGTYAANSKAVSVTNVAPTLTIGGAASVAEGSTYALTLSKSDVGADTLSSWLINWGDGTSQTVAGSATTVNKIYADNGAYTITATATDEDGTYAAGNSKAVTVTNVAPIVAISGSGSASKNVAYTLNLSSSDVGSDAISSWSINWGDGNVQNVSGNPGSVAHTYTSTGSKTVSATATDEDGSYAAASIGVGVIDPNAPVFATISGDSSINETNNYTLSLSATGSGAGAITGWTISWGDGTTDTIAAGVTSVNKAYADSGSYVISATVSSPDGEFVSNSTNVTVNNIAPVVSVSGNDSVKRNQTYTLNLSAQGDPGSDTISSWTIDWGDGVVQVVSGNPSSVVKTYAANGTYSIVASATDEDGTYIASTKFVNVTGSTPTASISGATSVDLGSTYTLALATSDPANDAITSWTIDWGDGNGPQQIAGSPATVSKTYATAGSYIISAYASNSDGNYAASNVIVAVSGAPSDTSISAAGDFNHDGKPDLLWHNNITGANSIWIMDGASHVSTIDLPAFTDLSARIGGVGDFNADGNLDIVWRSYATGKNYFWYMNSTSFGSETLLKYVQKNVKQTIVGVADFNKDGKADILWRNIQTGGNSVWMMKDQKRGAVAAMAVMKKQFTLGAVADFNDDGYVDVAWHDTTTGADTLWIMKKVAKKQTIALPATADVNWNLIAAGDFNGDGQDDILIRNSATGERHAWLMQGITCTAEIVL